MPFPMCPGGKGKWLVTLVSVCHPRQDSVPRHFTSGIHAFHLHPEQIPRGLTRETDEPMSGLNGQEEPVGRAGSVLKRCTTGLDVDVGLPA